VFFDNEKHGAAEAEKLASEKLNKLKQNSTPFSDATKHGERFLYHTNYVQRTIDLVASHFGKEFAEELIKVESSDTKWTGPLASMYGSHLVMVTNNDPGRYPELNEVYGRVKQDAQFDITAQKSEEAVNDIINAYDVRVEYKQNMDISADKDQNSNPPKGN